MNKKKSVLKRIRTNERDRLLNKAYKTRIKTSSKAFLSCLNSQESPNPVELNNLLSVAYSNIDKAVKKRVLHRNTGARKKAVLAKQLKAI